MKKLVNNLPILALILQILQHLLILLFLIIYQILWSVMAKIITVKHMVEELYMVVEIYTPNHVYCKYLIMQIMRVCCICFLILTNQLYVDRTIVSVSSMAIMNNMYIFLGLLFSINEKLQLPMRKKGSPNNAESANSGRLILNCAM